MTIIREFLCNFTKIKRTPIIMMHLLMPAIITILFVVYYACAGYHIIPDVRVFFILVQICYPMFISIVVPVFIQIDRKINGTQNSLGLVESRTAVYLGKLLFLLFFSSISMIICEICFYFGNNYFLTVTTLDAGGYFFIFIIFLFSNLFAYMLHMLIAFRFGPSISVLLGVFGTIAAGLLENPIGDKIWRLIPWEWGVRFLKGYFNFQSTPVFLGIICLLIMTFIIFIISIIWFNIWEGKVIQE